MTSYDPGSLSIPVPEDAVGTPIDSRPPACRPHSSATARSSRSSTPPIHVRSGALAGFYWRADSRLVGGRVLHDYLESSS